MSNPQLAEIDASLQAIVRRAYELGRGDALKKVVEVLNAEPPTPDRLALMAPSATAPDAAPPATLEPEAESHEAETHEVEVHTMNGREPAASTPWWRRPLR